MFRPTAKVVSLCKRGQSKRLTQSASCPLVLKRASASRLSGEWSDDDYDVLADGVVVGRIMKAMAAPEGTPGYGTLAHGHRDDRT
jgi:hypothetical protein